MTKTSLRHIGLQPPQKLIVSLVSKIRLKGNENEIDADAAAAASAAAPGFAIVFTVVSRELAAAPVSF